MQKLQYLKFLAFFELSKSSNNPDDIFRQNSPFVKLLTDFLREEMRPFSEGPLRNFFLSIALGPSFSFQDPSEIDLIYIEDKLLNFLEIFEQNLSLISTSVISLLRFIRWYCEHEFHQLSLNHRGLMGLFFLRYMSPLTSSPIILQIEKKVTQEEWIKTISFSKIILQLVSLTSTYNVIHGSNSISEIVQKLQPKMVEILEKLTDVKVEPKPNEPCSIEELENSVDVIRNYICDHEEELRKHITGCFIPSIFVEDVFEHIIHYDFSSKA